VGEGVVGEALLTLVVQGVEASFVHRILHLPYRLITDKQLQRMGVLGVEGEYRIVEEGEVVH